MGVLKSLMEAMKTRGNKPPEDQAPVINPTERQLLQRAKARAARLERIVIAYTGAEASAMTGRDVD